MVLCIGTIIAGAYDLFSLRCVVIYVEVATVAATGSHRAERELLQTLRKKDPLFCALGSQNTPMASRNGGNWGALFRGR
jgi:hypothetical protein